MDRVTIIIRGRVQGVFFRHSARVNTKQLGITGWIHNKDDDSVQICAEGKHSELEQFIARCHTGPPLARVDSVEVRWERATGEFSSFQIL